MRSLVLVPILCGILCAQQPQSESAQPQPKPSISPTARLLNAKTVYVKKIAGGDIAFDLVNNAIIDWPRYTVVDKLENADLLIEVSSPDDPKKKEEGGSGVKASTDGSDPRRMPTTTYSYPISDVKLIVRDAHTRAVLWSGTEPAKEAFRQAKTEENLIEATQKLVRKFRDRVEPPSPAQ